MSISIGPAARRFRRYSTLVHERAHRRAFGGHAEVDPVGRELHARNRGVCRRLNRNRPRRLDLAGPVQDRLVAAKDAAVVHQAVSGSFAALTRAAGASRILAMAIRLVVFDLDGTLIDSRRDLADSVNALLVELGAAPLDLDAVTAMVGEGAAVLVRRALAASGLPADTPGALDRFLAHYNERLTVHTKPYAGITEALDELQSHGLALAVLTNKPQRASTDDPRASRPLALVLSGDWRRHGGGPQAGSGGPAGDREDGAGRRRSKRCWSETPPSIYRPPIARGAPSAWRAMASACASTACRCAATRRSSTIRASCRRSSDRSTQVRLTLPLRKPLDRIPETGIVRGYRFVAAPTSQDAPRTTGPARRPRRCPPSVAMLVAKYG